MRWLVAALCIAGCSERSHEPDAGGAIDAGSDGGADAARACGCGAGIQNDRILVLSDDAELWSFDPGSRAFERQRGRICETAERPFSMAIDQRGRAFVLFVESRAVRTFDLASPSLSCTGSGLDPGRAGFALFGMSFSRDPATACEKLYVHSYSGTGPFHAEAGAGRLGVIDVDTLSIETLAILDYDGGELAGTGDGRLYAIAGGSPLEVVEYDRTTGARLETIPLPGLRKTNASAAAFFGGDLWIFTEAEPPACEPCLVASCGASLDACRADTTCAEHLACAIEEAGVRDECGGLLPAPMVSCLADACGADCFVPPRDRTSRVARLDLDGARTIDVVASTAPIRVVGAATSTCVVF